MGLKEEIKKIMSKFFGTKRLTAVSEIKNIEVNDVAWKMEMSDFDKSLKVDATPELQEMKFSEIKEEARREILRNVENFKNNILNSEEIKKINEKEYRTGEANGQEFICLVEMGNDGNLKATTVITPNSCSKTVIDAEGNKTYQESRMINGIMKTIINDDNGRSLAINGNFTQEEINKIKKFSENNKNKMNDIKQFKTEEEKLAYIEVLKEKSYYIEGENFSDKDKYLTSCAGKKFDENGLSVFREVDFVFDRNNMNSNPLLITLNTQKDGKITRQRFRLTKDNKYIDENSFRINDKGEPEYTELTYEEVKLYGVNNKFKMNYIEQIKSHEIEKKPMIPPGAINIHKAIQAEIEKENERKTESMQDMDMTK